jgi:hypothetical protein
MVPLLYERLTLRTQFEGVIESIDLEPFLQTRYTKDNPLRHTKHIQFKSSFHSKICYRCRHADDMDDETEDEEQSSLGEVMTSSTNLLSLLEECRDNSLHSFA